MSDFRVSANGGSRATSQAHHLLRECVHGRSYDATCDLCWNLFLCSDCGLPEWATAHATSLNTAAMREEFVGFHTFVPKPEAP
ncbi:MAG: hypothetical protein KGJ23_11445 [Euryarchaeota archaeon]|nr:hypothetical protein [Euryarchaeota archaeon]MDE1837209.1 hypothetical protein [Euryarchaeota archaeon]MDE1881425.1 hypothetical protein [Euryarchaeota archaeon]MDE2045365.1 hypothetical protein [Thermoplasmata archaeon]